MNELDNSFSIFFILKSSNSFDLFQHNILFSN